MKGTLIAREYSSADGDPHRCGSDSPAHALALVPRRGLAAQRAWVRS